MINRKMRSPREAPKINRFSIDQVMQIVKGALMQLPTDRSRAIQEPSHTLDPDVQRLRRDVRILIVEVTALLILSAACCAKVWLS
jgi:hypothetical protein